MSLHRIRTHPTPQEGCFGCKVSTLHIAHSSEWSGFLQREKVLSQDLAAFKRLTESGLAPEAVTGAADVERRATHKLDVNMGTSPFISKMTDAQKDQYVQATEGTK